MNLYPNSTAANPRRCDLCYRKEHGTVACNAVTINPAIKLLRLYALVADDILRPLTVPDEPLGFEPEDYPLR